MNRPDPNEASSLFVPPTGIVLSATFHQAVMTALLTPEQNYYRDAKKKERCVDMIMGQHGLICRQQNSSGKMETWLVPWANVIRVVLES